MRLTSSRIGFLLLAVCLACGSAAARKSSIVAGWRDEMKEPDAWKPLTNGNKVDLFAARSGGMTLRLPRVPDGFPYSYQWGGVTREASVDLGRYPIMAAYVSRLQEGSYAHLEVEDRDFGGRAVRTERSTTLQTPGLSVVDVGRAWGTSTRRMHLRMIVGGALTGASCDYAWVRFIRREDLPKFEVRVREPEVILEP